jgi:hypothetical protein
MDLRVERDKAQNTAFVVAQVFPYQPAIFLPQSPHARQFRRAHSYAAHGRGGAQVQHSGKITRPN